MVVGIIWKERGTYMRIIHVYHTCISQVKYWNDSDVDSQERTNADWMMAPCSPRWYSPIFLRHCHSSCCFLHCPSSIFLLYLTIPLPSQQQPASAMNAEHFFQSNVACDRPVGADDTVMTWGQLSSDASLSVVSVLILTWGWENKTDHYSCCLWRCVFCAFLEEWLTSKAWGSNCSVKMTVALLLETKWQQTKVANSWGTVHSFE